MKLWTQLEGREWDSFRDLKPVEGLNGLRRFFSTKLGKPVVTLRAGEVYASQAGEVIFTVLGSCIATCLYDFRLRAGGMNHFLLPSMGCTGEILSTDEGRYGVYAMELLIGRLVKLGAQRHSLRAKLFGGSNVLRLDHGGRALAESNIRFAREFLELERIPIMTEDVGGQEGRKILLFSDDARVLLKRFPMKPEHAIVKKEESHRQAVLLRQSEKPCLTLF